MREPRKLIIGGFVMFPKSRFSMVGRINLKNLVSGKRLRLVKDRVLVLFLSTS